MAKFRGNDVVTVLRGLSAVSRAAANVTEAELKEAWLSPSAQSGIKNWTFNYKVEDLPKYAKEAAERSFAVARGLKELSITSAQRLVNNTGVSSQQPHQQDQFKEEDMINSLNGNGKNFTNLQENENVSIQEKASNTLENPSLTAIIERSILNPTTVNSSVEAAAVNSSNGSKIANEEMLFHTSTSTSDTSNSSNKPNGISLGSSTILKETTPELSFNEAANASPLKDSPMAPATTTRTFSFSSTDESQTVEHSGIGFSSGMVQDKSEAIKNLDQRYHPDQSVTKTQTPAIELQSSQSSVEEERNTPDSQPAQPVARKKRASKLSETSREVSVPSSRIGRLASYGSLAAGLGIGALAEITRRTLGLNEKKLTDENAPAILDASPFLTEANAERIVSTLCKVRGAALKLGQMLSIQDNSLINPQLLKIFERVRESADFMPVRQMEKVLVSQLGSDWRSNFLEFQEKPFAAASVGQVHLATLLDGREVAMKIQYPGVAQGIESDINNLVAVMNVWNILPKGLYVEEFVDVAKRELSWEVDYVREAECTRRFGALVKDKPQFKVPTVIDELCTEQIFTSEFVEGISMEQCMELDQETRNHVAENILSLCLTELFEFRFMQTDPNWANFMYNPVTRQIVLLDFGASREYSKEFVDKYIRVIEGAAEGDRQKVLEYSQALGFLAGYETKAMEEAHVEAVMILGEAFRFDKPFDFGTQDTTRRIQKLIPVMLSQRLCPPPQESYSLHRKMSGAFLLCAKLRAKINCKPFFNEITEKYHALSDS